MDDKLTLFDHFYCWFRARRWGFIGRAVRRKSRQADREMLWPIIRNQVFNLRNVWHNEEQYESKCREPIAVHIYLDSAWRFCDEWRDEPEAKWYFDTMKNIGQSLFGGASNG